MKVEEGRKRQEERKEGGGQTHAIYVGDLSLQTTEAELYQMFNAIGQINAISIQKNNLAPGHRSLCHAYVTFFDPQSVQRAVDAYNFCTLHGTQIRVMPLNKEVVKQQKDANVVIKNLPKDADNQLLHDTFSIFGPIVSCKAQTTAAGECTGVGFVQFETPDVANVAINMINQTQLKGKKLVAAKCVPSSQRVSKKEKINTIFTNVYIKNYPVETTEEELRGVLEKYGKLTSFHMPAKEDGTYRGYAFANYEEHEQAVRAIECLHDSGVLSGGDEKARLYVQRAQSKFERAEKLTEKYATMPSTQNDYARNIYITNLPYSVDKSELLMCFGKYGEIVSARVLPDEKSERSFAYICYSAHDEAVAAIEKMNGAEVGGLSIAVAFFKTKRQRELEKASQMYGGYSGYNNHGHRGEKKRPGMQEATDLGYELYTLILSLAPSFSAKIEQAGFASEEEYARKITGMLLDLEEAEVRKALLLGNVLSQYVEGSLDEIIAHKGERDENERGNAGEKEPTPEGQWHEGDRRQE